MGRRKGNESRSRRVKRRNGHPRFLRFGAKRARSQWQGKKRNNAKGAGAGIDEKLLFRGREVMKTRLGCPRATLCLGHWPDTSCGWSGSGKAGKYRSIRLSFTLLAPRFFFILCHFFVPVPIVIFILSLHSLCNKSSLFVNETKYSEANFD